MARSGAYDEWEDVGLAFSAEEVAQLDPQKVAEGRLLDLVDQVRLLGRRVELPGADKPAFNAKAAQMMWQRATWMCVAASLPSLDREKVLTLPGLATKEGKALSASALRSSAAELVVGWREEVEGLLRWYVTISRRAGSSLGWSKQAHSLSNKVANALAGDVRTYRKLEELLESLPS